jgi:hypothetical protein
MGSDVIDLSRYWSFKRGAGQLQVELVVSWRCALLAFILQAVLDPPRMCAHSFMTTTLVSHMMCLSLSESSLQMDFDHP